MRPGAPVVLLVDDERHILSALQRSLRREGCELLTAHSVEAAVEVLDRHAVDLVLSDHKMRGSTGIELFAEIERRGLGIPRILMTGWPEEIPAGELARVGVTTLLPKPWDDAELKAALHQGLAMRGHLRG